MTEETRTKMTPEIADALVEDFIKWQIARDAVVKNEATPMQLSFYKSCSTIAGRPAWISQLTAEEALLFKAATERRAEKQKVSSTSVEVDAAEQIKMENAKKRRDFVRSIAVIGAEVELEERLQNSSDVLAKGTVSKVKENGTFEVTIEGGEIVRLNAYGICMPWQRQLQLKIDSYGYVWADDSTPVLKK